MILCLLVHFLGRVDNVIGGILRFAGDIAPKADIFAPVLGKTVRLVFCGDHRNLFLCFQYGVNNVHRGDTDGHREENNQSEDEELDRYIFKIAAAGQKVYYK